MAETATIARPYAEALFKATAEGGAADDTQRWLDRLAQVAQQPELLAFASDPNVSDAQVFDLISGIVQQSEGDGGAAAALPQAAQNFLRIVIDNKRLAVLPQIAEQFRELSNQRAGRSDAVVYSAFPIDQPVLEDLSGLLEKRFNQKLNLSVELQPELIGGIRVVVGDEVLDTSVRARLEQMKLALTS